VPKNKCNSFKEEQKMISLKNTIEKIKSLEAEKRSLMLEIEGLKKTADARAIQMESEVNALREELRALRMLMEGTDTSADRKFKK
jgi:hypothetical protein